MDFIHQCKPNDWRLLHCWTESIFPLTFYRCYLHTHTESLFFGISDGLISRLQSVQNAAARLVTGTRRCDHVTPVLRLLHWLLAASYLADDCRLVADARERRLRSTESWTCVVTRTRSTFGDRAFAAAGPGLWNSLPPHLRDANLPYSRFRRSLKTFFVWIVGPRRSANYFSCAV